jgi:hypothetical protein
MEDAMGRLQMDSRTAVTQWRRTFWQEEDARSKWCVAQRCAVGLNTEVAECAMSLSRSQSVAGSNLGPEWLATC